MFNHVYPAWHKPVQRVLFTIGALLCITLPVAYGKRRHISSKTLGIVLGLYFGLWLLFSLTVRFLVPSPRVESTLPTYTPSPIPVPVVLHSPSRSGAMPTSPAIRLHPSSVHGATPSSGTAKSGRGARFAVDDDDDDSYDNEEDYEDIDTKDGSLTTPAQHTTTKSNSNTVKFQTRPRGNTGDSNNTLNYPTFAAYRQAQHGNFDAFAQRIKQAFISQQQQQEEMERQKQLQEQGRDAFMMQTQDGSGPIHLQSLALSGGSCANNNNTDVSDLLSPPYNATITAATETRPTVVRSRSSSSAAASILGDLAERIKSGSLFSRSSMSSAPPARSMTDPQPQSQPQPQPLAAGSRSGLSLSSRPKSQRSPSRLGMDNRESSIAVEGGLEIVVNEDREAPTTPQIVSKGDETSG
ncbi:hypothetical protein BG006_001399 [Podila minutissima]|uniref:Uncharacterized protein n=1 Tax=Podila minutissima TaxID=64525 RepID=A0A9P5SAA9_9FUNG|nr:hypothetical protein BG006_001399 [Podila minutissima]